MQHQSQASNEDFGPNWFRAKLGKGLVWLRDLASWVLLSACVLLTTGLFVAGLSEVFHGLAIFAHIHHIPENAADSVSATLATVLKGFELMFLAPLPVLILRAITGFVLDGFGFPSATAKGKSSGISLHDVKSLTIGLMIAVVATDLIGATLSKDGLNLETAAAACLVILTLAFYYFALKRFDKHRDEDDDDSRRLEIITRSVVTDYEWQKLEGLSRDQPFACEYSEAVRNELGRLIALGFIDGDVAPLDDLKSPQRDSADLKDYVAMTPRGEEYMELRKEIENS